MGLPGRQNETFWSLGGEAGTRDSLLVPNLGCGWGEPKLLPGKAKKVCKDSGQL